MRDFIKENSASNAGDHSKVVYVGSNDTRKNVIIRWNSHLTLAPVVAAVGFKDRDAAIMVLRRQNPIEPVLNIVLRRGKDQPFSFRPGDVIFVYDPNEPES